jgi:DNA-binding MarR family transcriptional regulator
MPHTPAEASYPIDEINNRLFFRLFQTANTLHTKGSQALEEFGVTTHQWSVLGALSRPKVTGGMQIGDLSRFLLMSRQNLTNLLARLERDGLIERVTNSDDRRSKSIKLSAKGEVLWKKLQESIHMFYGQALKNLSFDDRIAFVHYFTVLQGNMSKL